MNALPRLLIGLVCFCFECVTWARADNRVLVIGIDGAGGANVIEAETPQIDTLAAAGAGRYDFLNEGALAPNPPEGYGASGVNWSTILTGTSAAHHGVVDNNFVGDDFANYPHFFKLVKQFDSSLYTASLANWIPINTFITPDDYTDLEIGYDNGTTAQQDAMITADAIALLQSNLDPAVIFLHFDQVDAAGHTHSWGSPQHLAAIETVDGLIGQIVAAIDARPGVASGDEDWLILVTSDHGGQGQSHFASQGPINWEVPFIVSGPHVPDGTAIQQGTLRDVAATALWHLGIDPFLSGLDGTIRGLPVFPPNGIVGDINQDGQVLGDGTGPAATDDVTAFLAHWLAMGGEGIADRYGRGDLNFDGTTDLSDWALLNNLNPAMGAAIARALQAGDDHVPEPVSAQLAATLIVLLCACAKTR